MRKLSHKGGGMSYPTKMLIRICSLAPLISGVAILLATCFGRALAMPGISSTNRSKAGGISAMTEAHTRKVLLPSSLFMTADTASP
jgi:hypothetical protein